MPVNVTCRTAAVHAGMNLPASLTLVNQDVAQYFRTASGDKLRLQINSTTIPTVSENPISTYYLHESLKTLVGNTHLPLNAVGVLFARQFNGSGGIVGLMFDHEFDPTQPTGWFAREGCAIFLETIGARHLGDQAGYTAEAVYTTIHELGHVFNLGHRSDGSNLMMASTPGTFGGPFSFLTDHRAMLDLCDSSRYAKHIVPGATRYGDIADLTGGGDYSLASLQVAATPPVTLRLYADQPEFWNFEPVELDIVVSVTDPMAGPVTIFDAVDPAYDIFDIWIDEPSGERRRYRPTKRFCEPPRQRLTIDPLQPFRRDISIFGGAGEFTFRQSGIHRLTAHMALPDGTLVISDPCEVMVRPAFQGFSGFEEFSRPFLTRNGARFLFHRQASPARATVRQLKEVAVRYPETPAAAGVLYALGRSAWSRASRTRQRRQRSDAYELLSRAFDHPRLSTHRREKAEALLNQGEPV